MYNFIKYADYMKSKWNCLDAFIVFSSVVLSLHLPLALVPLLKLTDSPLKMGNCANHRHWSAPAALLLAVFMRAQRRDWQPLSPQTQEKI